MVVVPANTQFGGALHTWVPVLDQTGDRNGLPTVWEPEDTIADVVGAMPGCQGCHFTLVGLLSPKTLSSEGSTKYEFSSKSSTLVRLRMCHLCTGAVKTAGPGGLFCPTCGGMVTFDVLIEATVVHERQVKL